MANGPDEKRVNPKQPGLFVVTVRDDRLGLVIVGIGRCH